MDYKLYKLLNNEEGQGLLEYGIIISFVAVMLIVSLIAFKVDLLEIYNNEIIDKFP